MQNIQHNNNLSDSCSQTTNTTANLSQPLENNNIVNSQAIDNQIITTDLPTRAISSYKNKTKPLSFILINSCKKNAVESQIVSQLHKLATEYSYQEYKTWLFTREMKMYRQAKYSSKHLVIYLSPLEYASKYTKPYILHTIVNLMETKYKNEYGVAADYFGWLIDNFAKEANLFQIIFCVLLHYKNNVHFLYPTLLQNYNIFQQCIIYAEKNNLTHGVIDLLKFVSENLNISEKLIFSKDFISSELMLHDNLDIQRLYFNLIAPLTDTRISEEMKKNNYLSFREFIPHLNFKDGIEFLDESEITFLTLEAISHNCNDTALMAITCGANININEKLYQDTYDEKDNIYYENVWVFCIPALFNAIYTKNKNMIEILLALGAKRYPIATILSVINTYLAQDKLQYFELSADFSKYLTTQLNNPSSLIKIATVNLAKNLVKQLCYNQRITLEDIKIYLKNYYIPKIACEINSIEDLFSMNSK